MGNSDLLFETIFKRKFSAADDKAYFVQLAAAHPYFSIAQFFLLLQTQKESTEYKRQAAKTSLLFNNPFWLQFQLQDALSVKPDSTSSFSAKESITGKTALKNIPPLEVKPDFATIVPVTVQVAETNKEISSGSATQTPDQKAPTTAGHLNDGNTPLVNDTDSEEETDSDQRIAPFRFKINISESDTKEDKITFEPLHTSDYFASLGIKLSDKALHTDHLGRKLKSFTEWLKEMKKLQPEQIPLQSEQADLSIQKLAEASNLETAVETEAMAEVLIQQGKKEKAINVYKKLSLLNPSKSAYFAAKIDQLKES